MRKNIKANYTVINSCDNKHPLLLYSFLVHIKFNEWLYAYINIIFVIKYILTLKKII